jgi:hypothetical protein
LALTREFFLENGIRREVRRPPMGDTRCFEVLSRGRVVPDGGRRPATPTVDTSQMAVARPNLYARTMSNREKIEQLRRDVSVDYAFGVTGLLMVADAMDELTARVAALEEEAARHQGQQPVEPGQDAALVEALDDLGGKIERLAKSIKKMRRR